MSRRWHSCQIVSLSRQDSRTRLDIAVGPHRNNETWLFSYPQLNRGAAHCSGRTRCTALRGIVQIYWEHKAYCQSRRISNATSLLIFGVLSVIFPESFDPINASFQNTNLEVRVTYNIVASCALFSQIFVSISLRMSLLSRAETSPWVFFYNWNK